MKINKQALIGISRSVKAPLYQTVGPDHPGPFERVTTQRLVSVPQLSVAMKELLDKRDKPDDPVLWG